MPASRALNCAYLYQWTWRPDILFPRSSFKVARHSRQRCPAAGAVAVSQQDGGGPPPHLGSPGSDTFFSLLCPVPETE